MQHLTNTPIPSIVEQFRGKVEKGLSEGRFTLFDLGEVNELLILHSVVDYWIKNPFPSDEVTKPDKVTLEMVRGKMGNFAIMKLTGMGVAKFSDFYFGRGLTLASVEDVISAMRKPPAPEYQYLMLDICQSPKAYRDDLFENIEFVDDYMWYANLDGTESETGDHWIVVRYTDINALTAILFALAMEHEYVAKFVDRTADDLDNAIKRLTMKYDGQPAEVAT